MPELSQHLLNRGQTRGEERMTVPSGTDQSQHLLNRGQTSPAQLVRDSEGKMSQHLLNRGQTVINEHHNLTTESQHLFLLIEVKLAITNSSPRIWQSHNTFLIEVKPTEKSTTDYMSGIWSQHLLNRGQTLIPQ